MIVPIPFHLMWGGGYQHHWVWIHISNFNVEVKDHSLEMVRAFIPYSIP